MENKYFCKDFYFSAFLLSMGCRLIEHTKTNGVTTFCFEAENVAGLANEYYTLQSRVEPVNFSNALKTLKTLIHGIDKTNANGFNNNGKFNQRG